MADKKKNKKQRSHKNKNAPENNQEKDLDVTQSDENGQGSSAVSGEEKQKKSKEASEKEANQEQKNQDQGGKKDNGEKEAGSKDGSSSQDDQKEQEKDSDDKTQHSGEKDENKEPDASQKESEEKPEADAEKEKTPEKPEEQTKSAADAAIDQLWEDDDEPKAPTPAPASGGRQDLTFDDFDEVDYAEDADDNLDFDALSFADDTDATTDDLTSGVETGLEGGEAPMFELEETPEGAAAEKYDDSADSGRPSHEKFYLRVLRALRLSEDMNVDSLAVARIKELLEQKRLPQLAVRDLMNEQLIDQQQLARAVARSQNRMEIMTLQDLPESARMLRRELDGRALNIIRERRIIPLRDRAKEAGGHELHLAHAGAMRDLVTEANLADILPGYTFIWHYAAGDVCGQYWVTGDEGSDLDEGMEAESLLDRIVTTAVDSKASDIHIDPHMKGDDKATIKYRVDGSVRPREVISGEQLDRLRVRIENIARMPTVNQNHPNKGAFSRAGFDWRVQIQPHAGRSGPVPRIVIRRLNPDSLSMERLGYPIPFIRKIQSAARASNGVVFWTGPTGSGKTESIHSAVISVDPMARGLSVHTIEDPPEKRVDGYAVQMEVAETDESRSGLELLKSSLRADPDVVIFGEVRDSAMAKLVFEAANTGHLVFSTLHTNTSIDAIIRLDELQIRGFLVSYIRGIAAQRLVRRLCTHCRQPMKEPDQWTRFCFDYYKVPIEGANLFTANPEGCPNCSFSGYRGRIAVAEWLVPNKELVQATADRDFTRLEEIARDAGWEPMGKMGVDHVKEGITDAEELGRVILELSVEIRDREEEQEEKKISKSAEDARV